MVPYPRASVVQVVRRLSTALAVTLCLAACEEKQITDVLDPPPPPPNTYRRGVVVGPGGKVTAAILEVWVPSEFDSSGEWKRIPVNTPIPPGARVETGIISGTGAFPSAPTSAADVVTAALFAGGIEGSGVFASRIAVLIEPTADSVSPYRATALQMNVARANHSATKLADGRVLLVGGVGAASNSINNSAELFSFTTRTFVATGSMRLPRYAHAAAALADGRAIIMGGGVPQANGFETASTEIFNPATSTFSDGPSMSIARFNATAVTLNDGRILVVGGNGKRSSEVYSPATNVFTPVGNMSVAHGLGHVSLKLLNGKVLVLGGDAATIQPSAVAEVFDPATNTFSSAGSMTSARMHHFATLLDNGLVLIGGGQNAAGDVLATAEVYNPTTNIFSAVGNMPLPGSERGAGFVSRVP